MIPLARWLPTTTDPLHRAIVERAITDIGICESPPGSNRSGVIDGYNTAAGAPVGSYWCASAVAAWWRDSGAMLPPQPASCDSWLTWSKSTKRFASTPAPAYAVLYGVPGDAQHIGVVIRTTPLLLAIEGNTSLGGFSRNGVAVDLKEVPLARVLGYVRP